VRRCAEGRWRRYRDARIAISQRHRQTSMRIRRKESSSSKFFFTSAGERREGGGCQAETSRSTSGRWLAARRRNNPLSDQAIAEMRKARQINIGGGTVREVSAGDGILPSAIANGGMKEATTQETRQQGERGPRSHPQDPRQSAARRGRGMCTSHCGRSGHVDRPTLFANYAEKKFAHAGSGSSGSWHRASDTHG